MATLNPYLHFNGNAEGAFNFYKSVFGGEFLGLQRYKDVPAGVPMPPVPQSEANRVMHVALPIGTGNVLMASDRPSSFGQATVGDNFHISINADSKEEAERLFNGLAAGGQVTMPLADAFWGAYFGMCKDKFGVQWMVNHEYNQNR